MNLIRLLVIFLVGFLVYRMIRNRLESNKQHKHKAASPEKMQNMVRCDICGLHIPEHEALLQAGRYFCSEQHRSQGAQDS